MAKALPMLPSVIEYLIIPFSPKSKSKAVTVVTCDNRMSQLLVLH